MSRIKTNVESLIARHALGISSGMDASAGLIASETLRSSIRAIHNANCVDVIDAIADGGLPEVGSPRSQQVVRENMTAAGCAIRDADFAIETSHLTRVQILVNS